MDACGVHASSLDAQSAARLAQAPAGTFAASDSVQELDLGETQFFNVASEVAAAPAPAMVLLHASLDAAMAPYTLLKRRILLLSGLATVLALLAAVVLARGVSRPVGELAEAALRIECGDYSRVPRVAGHDEFAQLGASFARMQDGIAEREAKIVHQATHDLLTGLPNRAKAITDLESAIERNARDGGGCAVVMLDLDHFKEINDTLGHGFGDRVLREVAQRLAGAVRDGDTVARLGGDEFFVLLDNVPIPTTYAPAPTNFCASCASRWSSPTPASTSMRRWAWPCIRNMVAMPRPCCAVPTSRCTKAKLARSGVAVYVDGSDEVHLRRLKLLADLPHAIERNELLLHFQPKLELRHGRVVHAEALLRWNHASLGAIRPDEFIALAEHSGFIRELTRHVLDQALMHNSLWREQGLDLGIAVNLSAMDLMDVDLVDFIRRCLQQHDVPAERLVLELTESALMRDIDCAVRMLHRLRDIGVRLSIDDFGPGYSSLAQLKRLPVHELKIDKSFVMQLVAGSDDAVIVRSTIELGHNMGLTVIAEGVEDCESLALLRSFHCDMAQGFLFSPPRTGEDLLAWHARFEKEARDA
jgi:predicted signal transduction protein with EAL and GGDEF domain